MDERKLKIMGNIKLKYKRLTADPKKYGEGFALNSLSLKDFEKFNPDVLGLGDITKEGNYTNALSAFLDLQGFTDFCNQVDSHLVIPEFLTEYLKWVFDNLADSSKEGNYKDHIKIWGSLPFYAKFLGDGILFLWDTDISGGIAGLQNIILHLKILTDSYKNEFLPHIEKQVSKPPNRLRCGVSRGQIISVGNSNDYVGSCINMAARLQKVSHLSFAVSRRGFNFDRNKTHPIAKSLVLKKFPIRGIGNDELIYIRKDEFENLSKEEKERFTDV